MATGQGPIYDDTVTFPTNKDDGGAPAAPTDYVASECNAQGNFNYAARTALRTGIYHGNLDQSASLPPVSGTGPSLGTTWTSRSGQFNVSEGGAPYVWIPSLDKVHAGDKKYGLKGDGSSADDAAMAAVITDSASTLGGGIRRRVVMPRDVVVRLTSPLTMPGSLGPVISGYGAWSTRFLLDPGAANGDGITINSSQWTVLEGFAIYGKASNPAGKALIFDYNPVVNASYHTRISDLWLGSTDTRDAFDTGIYWSSAFGNNSEVFYENCAIEKFTTVGVDLPGTQQYGHAFYRCELQGLWDYTTHDHTTPGGLYCIRTGGGVPALKDCSAGSVRGAVFNFAGSPAGAPIVIDGLDCENAYQLVGNGTSTSALAPSAGVASLIIKNSRFSCVAGVIDPNGIIYFAGDALLLIEGNNFYSETDQLKIQVSPASKPQIVVRNNYFQSQNSSSYDPIVISSAAGSTNFRDAIKVYDNVYVDSSYNYKLRDEKLNGAAQTLSLIGSSQRDTSLQDILFVDLTQFNAAAASQTITAGTYPARTTHYECRPFAYNYAVVSGGITLKIKVGTSSGGDELAQEFTFANSGVGDLTAYYGEGASIGSKLISSVGTMPSGTGTSHVYVTVTTSDSSNLGNGSVSNITRGIMHVILRSALQPSSLA